MKENGNQEADFADRNGTLTRMVLSVRVFCWLGGCFGVV